MTFLDGFGKVKPIQINTLGWLMIKLDKEVLDFLWKMIDKSTKDKDNMKQNLAGNISQSYSLDDDENYFFNNVLNPLANKWIEEGGEFSEVPCAENLYFRLHQFWVNYQNQYEINPYHDHSGLFSFAIWMKIPYDSKEQMKLPFLDGVKDEDKKVGCFEFAHLTPYGGIANYAYRLDPSYEGYMLFFPAKLRHTVYPFYETDEPRISIAGNIWYKTKA